MANASGPAAEGIELGGVHASRVGRAVRIFVENGSAWLGYSRERDPPIHGRKRLEYFVGSGNHGRTYLYSTGGYWFETPIASHARKHGYDMRPAYLDDKDAAESADDVRLPPLSSNWQLNVETRIRIGMRDSKLRNPIPPRPSNRAGHSHRTCALASAGRNICQSRHMRRLNRCN